MKGKIVLPILIVLTLTIVSSGTPAVFSQTPSENGFPDGPEAPFGISSLITPSPIWYGFSWVSTGTDVSGAGTSCTPAAICQPGPSAPWDFNCGGAGCWIKVTDGFAIGDEFEVFDGGVSIGTTPVVPNAGFCGNDILACNSNPAVSHGMFLLAPGVHSITIQVLPGSFSSGGAWFLLTEHDVPVGGFDVSINQSALLLAGVQSVSMWMIPVVLAGVGIGVFVIKRRN